MKKKINRLTEKYKNEYRFIPTREINNVWDNYDNDRDIAVLAADKLGEIEDIMEKK